MPLMTPLPQYNPVLEVLDDSVKACRRVKAWSEAQSSQGSPLAVLVSEHIRSIEAELCVVRKGFLMVRLDTVDFVITQLQDQLFRVNAKICKLVELINFYSHNKIDGRIGGLNVLFASRFILSGAEDTGFPQSIPNEEGITFLALELVDIIRAMTPDTVSGISPGNAGFAFEEHRSQIERCLSGIAARLEPRYVHTYESMDDTPYDLSKSANIAQGSFGVVRKVIHKRTGEAEAMKTFSSDNDPDKVLQEIGVLEVCDHPGIVKLVEAFILSNEDEDETMNIIMKPWAPYTLEKFLKTPNAKRRAQCPWFEPGSPQSDLCVYRIMRHLADAVNYLHHRSIKHKDIKPDNILLDKPHSEDVRPIVTDVGVSKVFVRGGSTNFDDCSYPYLAPEQVAKRESSLRADVWQLGCCFAMLLAVAKKGTLGYESLWKSFLRSGEDCSCQIAGEHKYFMRSFKCMLLDGEPKNPIAQRAYRLVSGMLDQSPENRIGIQKVVVLLEQLIQEACEAMSRGSDDEMTVA